MKRAAIVSAAGWKCGGVEMGLSDCPECFLPLGNGTTSLSRVATQLSDLDFDVFIGVGKLGYPFGKYAYRYQNVPDGEGAKPIEVLLEQVGLSPDDSPWTLDRLQYAARLGELIQVPDPGHGSSHDTHCIMMDAIGRKRWDGLLITNGDGLLPNGLLPQIIDLPRPCQYQICPNHSVFLFDEAGATFYREYCDRPGMRSSIETMKEWRIWSGRYPTGHPEGAGILQREGGITKLGPHNAPGGLFRFTDIDTPATYAAALGMIADGRIDMPRNEGDFLRGWEPEE